MVVRLLGLYKVVLEGVQNKDLHISSGAESVEELLGEAPMVFIQSTLLQRTTR